MNKDRLDNFIVGLGILRQDAVVAEMVPINEMYSLKSEYKPSRKAYFCVEVPNNGDDMLQEDKDSLRRLGWREECDGTNWVFYG